MHSMIQTFAEAREQWDRMKPRRFGPGANETNLPPLPRNLSSRGSPNTKSPGLDSAVSDTSNVSPHSTDSAATAVPTSARSPAFDLTPSGDDPVPEEVRQKRLEQCAMIVREIYETELTFKDNMGILTGALGQQMRSAAANPDGPLLPLFDVETIFKHAPDLLIFSHSLCNEFRAASERFVEDQSAIGRVFANNFGGFDIFIRFVTNYSRAKATIRRNERDSAQFKKFLAERQSSPECKKQDIHSYLIMPIQRAMRYYLLLHTLLKKMDPANTEAYNLIENACLYMNEISQIMNCMQQQEEEFNGLFEMHDLVEYCPDTILSATRRLEKSFVCEDLGKHKRHMKLFVLTDLVIFARMKKDSKDDYDAVLSGEKDQEALAKGKRRYALKEMCFNNHIRVQEAKDGDDASILRVHLVNPFRIDGDGKRKEKVVSRRTSTSSKARSSSLAAQRNNSTVTQRSSSAHRSNSATPQKTGKWPFSKPVAEVAVPEADNECDDDADSFSIAPSIVPSELSSRAASPSRRPDEAADVSRAGTMRSMAESTAVGGDVSRAGTMRSTAETASNGTEIARVGTMRSIAESAASNRTSIYVDDAASVFENVDDDSEIVSLSLKFQDGAAREDIVRLIRQLSTVPMVRRDFVGEFVL
ncbi:Dbl homology domain-containing protein [Hyaloraphidium curvatum]|nr:Dbl homology domain-containing protein [Hyaloraphidium curvatum]